MRTGISASAGGESIGLTKDELLDSIFEVLWFFSPLRGWGKRVDRVGTKKETTSVPCL